MPSHPSPKSVSFAPTAPEVHTIPDHAGTWATNELPFTATPEQQTDSAIGERLARESYALASAMIAQDAAALGLSLQEYASAIPPYRPHQIRRKPLPLRAQGLEIPASRPLLCRATSSGRVGDFVGPARVGAGEKEDMRERRASLHLFEDLAIRAAGRVKKMGVKAQKKMLEKMG